MRRIFRCGNERGMRERCRKNTVGRYHRRRGGHAGAYQGAVCWSLDFNWTPLYLRIYLTIRILKSALRKMRLASDLSARNTCVSRGVPVVTCDNGSSPFLAFVFML